MHPPGVKFMVRVKTLFFLHENSNEIPITYMYLLYSVDKFLPSL